MNKSLINIQANIFNHLHPKLQHPITALRILPKYASWLLSKKGHAHTKRILTPYQNRYQGYRCIVIGNGPSLKQMDLELLRNEYTFGLNRIYLLFEKLGFATDFLVSINRLVIQQFAEEISHISNLKIISWPPIKELQHNDKTVYVAPRPDSSKMKGEITSGYYPLPGSVTNVAIETAFFMGFSEVILIGVDHSFAEQGIGGQAIVSGGADINHFTDNYFGKGVVWQLPNYTIMENAYSQAKILFNKNNRSIFDATKDGKLQIFTKRNLEDALNNSSFKNKS